MVIRMGKKIVCIKEIPSNLIEEAIFILKSDVIENQDNKYEGQTKEILLDEAEHIVAEYVSKLQNKKSLNIIENKKQMIKESIYITGILIILGICICTVI